MLYGHVETLAERVDHLLRLREQQDRSGGFLTFIPLPTRSAPPSSCRGRRRRPTTCARSRSRRLLLDNFPHVEAYWVMLGEETASIALHFGASDVNGTLEDERIAHMAQAASPGGPGARADPPDHPRRRQGAGGARRALQRRRACSRTSTCSRPVRTSSTPASGSTARRALAARPRRRCSSSARSRRRCASARIPEKRVTYVIDTNPNYTNVCTADCQFCAFYRKPATREDATRSRVEEVMAKMETARRARRHHRAAAGRPQPRDPAGTSTRRSCARRARRYPGDHAALLLGARDPADGRGVRAARSAACSTRSTRPGSARCPAAAPRSCPSACASGSRPRRAGPRPGSTCTARRIASACARPRP